MIKNREKVTNRINQELILSKYPNNEIKIDSQIDSNNERK